METLQTTCIMCPLGCSLTITKEGKLVSVAGNSCDRGKQYGTTEITSPTRVLTSLVKTKNGVVPVKTTEPIPKTKIKQAMREIETLRPTSAKYGRILIKYIAGTDANLIVTK